MSPTLVAFWIGVLLGVNGGVLIAAILAANARQAACQDAYAEGRKSALRDMEQLGRHYAQRMEDDIAAAFPAKPKDAA